MEFRQLGTIKKDVSILTLGGCALGWLHEQEPAKAQEIADNAIKDALKHGINMIDVAPSYGEAEIRFKPSLQKIRNKIFLAEKTMERTKTGAWDELHRSLQRLGVIHFDLYQFHAVSSLEELDQIFSQNGAMQAFQEAQETGLINHIGITCHNDLRILIKALELYPDFSTVLFPIYVAAMVHPHPTNNFHELLKIAQERNIGVIAIKAISRKRWVFAKSYGTWYHPLDDQEWVDKAVWYTLSQKGVTTYSLPCDLRLWPYVVDAVTRFKLLDETEQQEVLKDAQKANFKPLFPQ